jgi:NAD(P)-dependent dehydrogenase (short-subunit alcohol dehydrogenase family)
MTQRTVFITGSSSGLGRAAAKLFSARGWKVVATMRNPEKEKELADLAGVVLLPLDITQQLRYVAGADAKATYATRLELGDEAFREAMRQRFFGAETQEGA